MKRCFISINLPEEAKKEIEKIQEQLPEFKGKKIEIQNLHLTLKFLGEILDDKIEKIKKRLSQINFEGINCEMDSIGVFSEEYLRIIWLHLAGCDELQKKIDESLEGIFDKEKRFMSHITIARIKFVGDKKKFLEELRKIKIPKIIFFANKFYLMESLLKSNGPDYFILGEFGRKKYS